MDQNVNTNPVF